MMAVAPTYLHAKDATVQKRLKQEATEEAKEARLLMFAKALYESTGKLNIEVELPNRVLEHLKRESATA